ncbi:acyl-CoA binding protein [Aspergillus saccharolyticus JOP 1030-1]|uniref:Acyl-CoA binding protein n=1 Tax=Aspergillus saccharolyticus JOP 1030-1 TaxID=1450539 RepID=A0A318ZEQ9_9EURO|nr:acyl-CoA binding protein [Aspergillus saccharolyticus JOP 1030-1]PYH45157.1 acyl-CoA binding protein [Aspergillus saccharolyticus JOP 1030-1]
MSTTAFTTALSAAQSKAKYAPAVQTAAEKVNADALSTAVEAVLAGGDNASVEGEQADALKSGFEFATLLVKELASEPGQTEMLTLYKYFKRSRNEEPAQPSFYQMEAKFKYNAWKEISHISQQRAQALYIKEVNDLIEKYHTRD